MEGTLLIELARFPEALAHLESIREHVNNDEQTQNVVRLRILVCTATILAELRTRIEQECGNRYAGSSTSQNAMSQYRFADRFLHEGKLEEARIRADIAAKANRTNGNLDDTIYSTLIRGQAERRLGNIDAVRVTLSELQRFRGELDEQWGKSVTSQYLSRPLYAIRWQEIERRSPN